MNKTSPNEIKQACNDTNMTTQLVKCEQQFKPSYHMAASFRQCSRNAVIKRDGKNYCHIHDPDYINQKSKARREKEDKRDEFLRCKKCEHICSPSDDYCPRCGTKRP